MIHIRGIAVLGSIAFVRESYGPGAHDKVLQALPPSSSTSLVARLQEASWKPLRDLAAYVETARVLFASDDGEFYLTLGRYVGRVEREKGGFRPMMAEPSIAMRLAPTVWSALYDSGRMEFVTLGLMEGVARLYDFRANRALCQANAGAIEGLAGTEALPAHVDHAVCALDGGPFCEFRVLWK